MNALLADSRWILAMQRMGCLSVEYAHERPDLLLHQNDLGEHGLHALGFSPLATLQDEHPRLKLEGRAQCEFKEPVLLLLAPT